MSLSPTYFDAEEAQTNMTNTVLELLARSDMPMTVETIACLLSASPADVRLALDTLEDRKHIRAQFNNVAWVYRATRS